MNAEKTVGQLTVNQRISFLVDMVSVKLMQRNWEKTGDDTIKQRALNKLKEMESKYLN